MEKTYCPECKQDTKHNILHQKKLEPEIDDSFSWFESFEIIECAGCENIQFKRTYHDETMEDYYYNSNGDVEIKSHYAITCYPASLKNHNPLLYSDSLPQKIKTIYDETLDAFKAKCYILTGAGFRAIIEAVCIDKNIKGKDLQQKINNLLKEKFITEKEWERLHSVRFLGNDSIHEMLKPEPIKLYLVLGIIEHLLNNIYLIDLNIEGNLETMINKYEQFEQLIWAKYSQLNNNDEFTIKMALGKNIRRFENEVLIQFVQKMKSKIQSSEIGWLSMHPNASSTTKASAAKFLAKK